ncbi:MAG: T9SS type A sorting domain-containing protein [Bacteroidetes bacterium]|nr:T9SS type A sorting domain-containing protein [Bacteroidota bacterium]
MKRKSYIIVLVCCLLNLLSQAQSMFQKSMGGIDDESGFFIQQCSDHGFAFGGFTQNYGDGIYLLKTDSLASLQWSRIYHGGSHQDQGYSVQQTADGGFIIGGYTKSFASSGYNATLIKTNATGDTLWTGLYGGSLNDFCNVVRQTSDGGYIMAGYTTTYRTGSDSAGIYLIKTGQLGDVKWSKSLGGNYNITDAYSIVQTSDKGFMITGYTNAFAEPNGDAFLLKTDSLGNPLFTKTYGFKGSDWGNSMQQTSDGGFIITGGYSTDSTSNDIDILAIRTDANGDTLWVHTFGGPAFECGQSVRQAPDGTFIIGGYTISYGAGNFDALLLKLDANGNQLHEYTYGATGDDEGNAVFATNRGGYVLCGNSNSFNGGTYYDVYLVKTDSMLNSGCKQALIPNNKRSHHVIAGSGSMLSAATPTVRKAAPYTVSSGVLVTDACTYVGINEQNQASGVFVFPNPATGYVTIRVAEYNGKQVLVTLKSILGNTVYQRYETSAEYGITIPLEDQASGIYLLEVSDGQGRITTKLQIQK